MKITTIVVLACAFCAAGGTGVALAAPIVYPAKGQSAELQQKDQGECHSWAVTTTGVDPAQLAAQAPVQVSSADTDASGGGERLRGTARGALGGAAIGAIAGDAGKGAGVGAVVGLMAGGRQARHNEAQAKKQAEANRQAAINRQNAERQDSLNTYNRAIAACLEGRGYSVK